MRIQRGRREVKIEREGVRIDKEGGEKGKQIGRRERVKEREIV